MRLASSSRPAFTAGPSAILMLTSWSDVFTPAELSMKSVLMRPPRAGELDACALRHAEIGALADDLGAAPAAR